MSARYKKERKTRGYQECSTRSGRSIPEKGKTRPKILTDIEPAGRSGQLKLVIAQFRYYKDGKEWIYNSLDELKKQMPLVRKRYTSYETYANDVLEKVFSKEDLKSAQIKTAQTLLSTLYLNQNGNYQPKPL